MFRLFRSIRRKLFSEGKIANYSGYAIGEIVLIVAGILIALQISDWNEVRKTSDKEIEILESIQDELKSDLESMAIDIRDIEQDLPYQGALRKNLFDSSNGSHYRYLASAFETLKAIEVVERDNSALVLASFKPVASTSLSNHP